MLRPWDFHVQINQTKDKAVYIQIADAIIEAIGNSKLLPGSVLPGSRYLAAHLKCNRTTVLKAFDSLISQGWLISKKRKGTFVAEQQQLMGRPKITVAQPLYPPTESLALNIIFDDGLPDSRIAPIKELARSYRQIFNKKGRWQMMGYGSVSESFDFKNAIVKMLNFKRGMKLSMDEVFITRGSQMAIYLSAQLLLKSGDKIIVENPGYRHAWSAFEHTGAKLLPVGVDSEGVDIEELEQILLKYKNIKAIYVTPHHQYPTTVTMSTLRRIALVELSNTYGFTIIEDDFDNEFHFGKSPILPVCSSITCKNYIYIGSLSKVIAPALRIGFLATSRKNIEKIASLRKMIDVQGDIIMEQAVLQLINDGEIKRHLKRATTKYKTKRDWFEMMINKHLGKKVSFVKPAGGLAFWIVPVGPVDIIEVSELLLKKGVRLLSPLKFSYRAPIKGFRLGYASLSEQELEDGLIIMSKLL